MNESQFISIDTRFTSNNTAKYDLNHKKTTLYHTKFMVTPTRVYYTRTEQQGNDCPAQQ